jgi:hypothetical protein
MNNMQVRSRASHKEIMDRLSRLLGGTAVNVVATAVSCYHSGDIEQALQVIAEFDEQIGGWHGVFAFVLGKRKVYDVQDRPIYRPFYYITMRLESDHPQFFTRDIVRDSCLHIEGILKSSIRLTFWERIQASADRLPMGSFLRTHKKELITRLSSELYELLLWLNDSIYIFDKHGFSDKEVETIEDEDEARLFELDEALAVYFIARHCGQQLIKRLGLTPSDQMPTANNTPT